MRLVTWKPGPGLEGGSVSDNVITALKDLEADVVILTQHLTADARRSLLASLADIGLMHQLAPTPRRNGGDVLIASRLKLEPGRREASAIGDHPPVNMLHAYAPSGLLDVLGLEASGSRSRPEARRAGWEWLMRAAGSLKDRRAVLIGSFDVDVHDEQTGDIDHLRYLIGSGWKHAVPASGASYPILNGDPGTHDEAFLSPSLQKINSRYVLPEADCRGGGTKAQQSRQPALVVDLQ